MIRTIRKYRKSIGGIIIVSCVVMVMTGFGLGSISRDHVRYAINIDDTSFTYDEFNRQRRQLEENYRRMLGNDYYKLIGNLNLNLG